MRFLVMRTSAEHDWSSSEPPYEDAVQVPCSPHDFFTEHPPHIWLTPEIVTAAALAAIAPRLVVGELAESGAMFYLDDRVIESLPVRRWLEKEGITHFVEIYDGYRE